MVIVAQAGGPGSIQSAWLIPALPLAGAVLLLLFGRRIARAAGAIATLMLTASFAYAIATLLQVIDRPQAARSFTRTLYSWISSGSFKVAADYRIDPLSIVMILVVTGVGSAIHLYSIGYMRGDPREHRYFAYLNLFAFSMLVLVMANNFLVMYVGWELVGLCSYLLIGFWFERPSASVAAKKAFITNRVGDVGFALGIILIFVTFGTLDFDRVFAAAGSILGGGTATAIALLLFAGAVGKSAQIPLYVWLPDAMEGPTPVSALIHAATMVTAGVYMVARTHVLFDASSVAPTVVASIGVATALLAAVIAFNQDDIKRVLAYSTISQLGFMFLGLGTGAYAAGIFHLFTHALFKALMFLGAGSVMHALRNETDMTKMGALGGRLPWTAGTFVLGWLAIIGFPGTSGFFSKDQILAGAYGSGKTALWALGIVATVGTGFYMSRLVFLTFFGPSRVEESQHPHESPPVMVFPLVILAAGAALGGIVGLGARDGTLQRFLAPSLPHVLGAVVVQTPRPVGGLGGSPSLADAVVVPEVPERQGGLSEAALSSIATAAGLGGAAAAGFMYLGAFDWRRRRERAGFWWRAARNKFGVDEAYQFLFTSAGRLAASTLAYVVDVKWIDGAVNGLATLTGRLSAVSRRLQTGLVRTYALGVLGGAVVLLALLVARAGG
jgi:NADH-quinone oxidoreductase subunit L